VPCFASFYICVASPADLHSFPTRRSSDLPRLKPCARASMVVIPLGLIPLPFRLAPPMNEESPLARSLPPAIHWMPNSAALSVLRSEEHTSELQSRENLVCRLLLVKKKQNQ